jgi:lipopolysaccharide transport system ATP-binding protein
MSNTAIHVENLSKKYILGHHYEWQGRSKSFREAMSNGMKTIGKKLTGSNDRDTSKQIIEEFWALQNLSFEIKQGDRVGIIGRNGAGKSTLLKVLSRIVDPTRGRITIQGRVASLLEVGTGFHPELTGRENIYLNGAILGMSKIEILKKFDEIVAFSEVEKFLDTPVKRYSSGMYVRLAFAVAAHLEPEILIVDEVLAVGDMQFQKKCLGKMEDVSQGEGRTVLFVSHNMNAIQRLCSKCVMLEGGKLVGFGDTQNMVFQYMSGDFGKTAPSERIDVSSVRRSGSGQVRFVFIQYSSLNKAANFYPYTNGCIDFLLGINSDETRSISRISVIFFDRSGTKLVNADTIKIGQQIHLSKGLNQVKLRISNLHLNPGVYILGLFLANSEVVYDNIESAFEIEVIDMVSEDFGMKPEIDGVVSCNLQILK